MTKPASEQIPDVAFSERRTAFGSEVLDLADLARRSNIEHPIDQAHRIQFTILMLVEGGAGTHMIDFVSLRLEAPCLLLVPAGRVQAFSLPPGIEARLMLISNDLMVHVLKDSTLGHLRGLFHPSLTPPVLPLTETEGTLIGELFSGVGEETRSPETSDREQIILTMLRLLLLQVNRSRKERPALQDLSGHLAAFLGFLQGLEEGDNPSRNARDHARRLGFTYKHLNEICRKFTGLTAKRYIDERLVLESKRLLAASGLTVAEIGIQLGFEEPTNFGKFFKKHTAQSPGQFRTAVGSRDPVQDLPSFGHHVP